MPPIGNQVLLSDAAILRKIKTAQFLRQIPAIVLLLLSFLLNYVFPALNLYTLALVVAIIAIGWYLFVGMNFRFKQRIPMPSESAILSPLQGKIRFIRSNEEITLLNIKKIFLDSVEIRCPHDLCQREEDMLKLNLGDEIYAFRFNAKNIRWFEYAKMKSGNVIGMMIGGGSCTVSMPKGTHLELAEGGLLDAGDPILDFKPDPVSIEIMDAQ